MPEFFCPPDEILDCSAEPDLFAIGRSREGRKILAAAPGSGPLKVSLIGGCHADEPVGPATLERLAAFLGTLPSKHPLLETVSWFIVPHVNPDGNERNRRWIERTAPANDCRGKLDRGYDLGSYLANVLRELPGEDLEFGFPHNLHDSEARPETLAVAAFLRPAAPFDLHGSFHGMALAPGPWFLIESSWSDRTSALRQSLRQRVHDMGYRLFDPDRKGEKGFHRIDKGFTSRPDSRSMRDYFMTRNDPATAAKFRPSSMEFVRSLGGDPFTFVSEMPLFLTADEKNGRAAGIPEIGETRRELELLVREQGEQQLGTSTKVRPMPIRDQQRLQLALLEEAVRCVAELADL